MNLYQEAALSFEKVTSVIKNAYRID